MIPQLSIHIVTHNSASHITACLTSVVAQVGISYDVIVLDNASQDATVTLVQDFAFVRVVSNRVNRGYSAAHNQALALSDSPYVLTLNPDATLAPDFAQEIVHALDHAPACGSAAGCVLRVEALGQAPHSVDSAGLYLQRNRRQRLHGDGAPLASIPHETRLIWGVDGAVAVYRRAMLDDIAVAGEVFDEDFFMHKEDVDLAWRAQAHGWHCLSVPTARAHHIRHFRPGQRQQVTADMRYYGVRNRYLLLLKNDRWRDVLRDSPFIIAYDLQILVYLLLFERETLRALVAAWRLRGCMLAKRKRRT
jgi:GT2 family glycosyltransferase